jgi:polysaccharide biosynthesis protein PslH
MTSSKALLWICQDIPYPCNYGGRLDTWKRIQELLSMGFEIDLVATVKNDSDSLIFEEVTNQFSSVTLVKRQLKPSLVFSWLPYQIVTRNSLRKLSYQNKSYAAVILESEFVIPASWSSSFPSCPVFLRVHNDETAFAINVAFSTNSLKVKIFHFLEAFKFFLVRPFLCNKAWKYLFISQSEMNFSYWLSGNSTKLYVPSPVLAKSLNRSKSNRSNKVLFVGSLFMANNYQGIVWYLTNIHPRIIEEIPDYQLLVAGNTKQVAPDLLKVFHDTPNCTLFETPTSLDSFYDSAAVFINPVKYGAGTKLKTISAIENMMPLISTKDGVSGVNLVEYQDYIPANSVDDFVEGVKYCLFDDEAALSLAKSALSKLVSFSAHRNLFKEFF